MSDDNPNTENESTEPDPSPEPADEQPQSLSDTEADLQEFFGSLQPQGEKRVSRPKGKPHRE